jgi:tetratricopeptide (TPR) repeat protein
MYDRVTTTKQKREVLFWLGDAKKTEGEYEVAAQYYLRSAFANSEPYDLWGQSARYSAAEALADARLFDDAERIYKELINEAGETKRAAALYRRLQELWVEKQEPAKPK